VQSLGLGIAEQFAIYREGWTFWILDNKPKYIC